MKTPRKIGAHVSVAGGLLKAIERAQNIGANCLQIFSSPPRQWQGPKYSNKEMEIFRNEVINKNLLPVFVHGVYLINLASDSPVIKENSIRALISDLIFASQIGAKGVIFHLGSHHLGWSGSKRKELVKIFQTILDNSPDSSLIIVENAAGSGHKIGFRLKGLRQIKNDLNNKRIKFCLDTAHAFASGYDLRTKTDVDNFVDKVEKQLGWNNIVAIHSNDSKVELGKNSDRHENIGSGKIGLEGFRSLINNPKLINIPFILETPGFNNEGPDMKNIKILNSLVDK